MRQVLQSVTDCYYKARQLLKSVTDFITKCVRYYKVWQLLQSEMQHQIKLAEKRNEEGEDHSQLQSVMRFTQM